MSRRSIDEILAHARSRFERVEPAQLADELAAGALLVDIRPPDQRERDGDLPGALVIPRNQLEWRLDPASDHRLERRAEYAGLPGATTSYDRRVIIACDEGYQSSIAAATLLDIGLDRATDLVGGFQYWRQVVARDKTV